jgi:4-aminobutyrate aminotransferase
LNEPDPKATSKICWRCYELGLVMIQFAGYVLRVQPPLIITYDEIDKAMEIIDRAIDDYMNGRISDDVLDKCRGW